MRSRYTAYAMGRVDHIISTTHPDSPHFEVDRAAWEASIRRFCNSTRFLRLRILEHSMDEDTGQVTFCASLEQGGRNASFTERSRFERVDGCWLYRSGDRLGDTTP